MGEEKQEEKVPAEVEAGIDMSQFRVKVDHFQGVHTLGEEGALAGAPNFRQVCLALTTHQPLLCVACRCPAFLSLVVLSRLRRVLSPS